MYHPITSSCSQRSNTQANAIISSAWFVNLYSFKPSADTSLPTILERLFLLNSGASLCVLNLFFADQFLKCSKTTLKMMNLKHSQWLIELKFLFSSV